MIPIEELLTELKAAPAEPRITILTGPQSRAELRSFLNSNENRFKRILKPFWKEQRDAMNVEVARQIIDGGHVPPQAFTDSLTKMITAFVGGRVRVEYSDALERAGSRMAGRVNNMRKQEFVFDRVSEKVLDWTTEQGGDLIVDLTTTQHKTINALLQHQTFQGITSPYVMSQRLRPLIPLLERDALAVTRLHDELAKTGLSQTAITRQTTKYSEYLLNNRAMAIARTELSDAYNFGQFESIIQARDEGHLPGPPWKEWIAGGANPCDFCLDNMGEGVVKIRHIFSSGDDLPTAHTKCVCSMGYSVKRDGIKPTAKVPSAPTKLPPTPKRPVTGPPAPGGATAGHIDVELYDLMSIDNREVWRRAWLKERHLKATGKELSDDALESLIDTLTAFTGDESGNISMAQLKLKRIFGSTDDYKLWSEAGDVLEDYFKYAPQYSPESSIYRGVKAGGGPRGDVTDPITELIKKLESGEVKAGHRMTLDTTSHWSTDISTAEYWNGDVIFETKGVKASSSIAHFSEVAEQEVMVSRATKYKISNVSSSEFGGHKTYRVVLEPIG